MVVGVEVVYGGSGLMGKIDVISGTMPSGAAVPVLRYVLVSTAASMVGLATGSVRLKVRAAVSKVVSSENVVTLGTGVFSRVIHGLPSGSIIVRARSSGRTVVAYRGTGFGVTTRSKSSFSCLPTVRHRSFVAVSRFALGRIIHRAVFSVTSGSAGGVVAKRLFRVSGSILEIISLSNREVSVQGVRLGSTCRPEGMVIPKGALRRVDGVVNNRTSTRIRVSFAGGRVIFRFSEALIISELVRNRCFQVSRVLSDSCRAEMRIGGGRLLSYVSHTALLVGRKSGGPVVVSVGGRSVRLGVGSRVKSVSRLVFYAGSKGSLVVKFGPGFLVSTLHIVRSRRMSLCFVGTGTPYFVGSRGRSCVCLVLPIGFGTTIWARGVVSCTRRAPYSTVF